MRTVSVSRAQECLSDLVDAVEGGEQVVLKRGSRRVAALVPVETHLDDTQARRLWQQLARDRRAGKVREFASASEAVAHLRR